MIKTNSVKAWTLGLLLAASGAGAPVTADEFRRPDLLRFAIYGHYQWTPIDEKVTTVASTLTTTSSASANGFGMGAGLGFDWIDSRVLYGVEGDFTVLTGLSQTANFSLYEQRQLGTLRGRLGYFMRPDWLVYGTAGFATLALGSESKLVTTTGTPENLHATRLGGVIGIGTEVDWHLFAKLYAEYLHASFGDWSYTRTLNTYKADSHANILRLGVRFAFGDEHFLNGGW